MPQFSKEVLAADDADGLAADNADVLAADTFFYEKGSLCQHFRCLGTPPGGLGHHFEPKARIFVILVPFPGQKLVPFWFLF